MKTEDNSSVPESLTGPSKRETAVRGIRAIVNNILPHQWQPDGFGHRELTLNMEGDDLIVASEDPSLVEEALGVKAVSTKVKRNGVNTLVITLEVGEYEKLKENGTPS